MFLGKLVQRMMFLGDRYPVRGLVGSCNKTGTAATAARCFTSNSMADIVANAQLQSALQHRKRGIDH